MDQSRFDELTKRSATKSRRGILKGAVGFVVGGIVTGRAATADAAKCRSVGQLCTSAGNCCTGICEQDRNRRQSFCQCPPDQKGCRGACIPQTSCCVHDECSSLATQCAVGRCDSGSHQCYAKPLTGQICTPGNLCDVDGICQSDGMCIGSPRDCSDLTSACLDASCDPSTGTCVQTAKQDGTSCGSAGEHCCSGACQECCNDADCATNAPAKSVPTCSTGVCTYPCENGFHDCSGACVSNTDAATCGNRCTACPEVTPYCENEACVECRSASDCASPTDLCAVATCVSGVCGFGPADSGTVCGTADGECESDPVCNGESLTCPENGMSLADGSSCDDGNPCTRNTTCSGGVCGGGTTISNCETCSSNSDCAQSLFNPCARRVCGENGTCITQYVRSGLSCPNLDPACIIDAGVCEDGPVRTTMCTGPLKYKVHPACSNTCEVGQPCRTLGRNDCQKYECVYFEAFDRGGCVVVADTSRNGQYCNSSRIVQFDPSIPTDEYGLFCLEGICDNGVCDGEEEQYSPIPANVCCFDRPEGGSGRPIGGQCNANAECCSNSCIDNRCVAT